MKILLNIKAVIVLGSISLFTAASFAQYTGPVSDTVVALLRLKALGYWVDTSFSVKTAQNKQAIIAFQKLNKSPRTGKLSQKVISLIMSAHTPIAKDSLHTRHIEIDLNHQVLLIIDSFDRVERILSVSTGNGKEYWYPGKGLRKASTPRGRFKVYYKIKGWKKSELGMLFDPLYIVGGVAIHGAQQVPAVPASHGCIRIPLFASREMYRMTPIGTPVVVYGSNPN